MNATDSASPTTFSQVLTDRKRHTFSTLAPLPSNIEAIEAGLLFTTGMCHNAAIVGPSGWGKSHLLDSIAERCNDGDAPVRPLTLDTFLANPARYESAKVLILDDVQDVIRRSKKKQQLYLHLERRIKAGRSTALAFTAAKATGQIRNLLPFQREWTVASIGVPTSEERILLLRQMAAGEGLNLSTQLIRVVACQMHGDGRTLSGALKRLRIANSNWLQAEETLRACGMLDPFFADNGHWDLRRKILRLANAETSLPWKVNPLDLALYTMLCVAGLSELDVARSAQVEPAEAYTRAAKFRRQLAENADVEATARRFIESVVLSMTQLPVHASET